MNLVRVAQPCPSLLCFLLGLVPCVRELWVDTVGGAAAVASIYHTWLLGRPWLGKLSIPLAGFFLLDRCSGGHVLLGCSGKERFYLFS